MSALRVINIDPGLATGVLDVQITDGIIVSIQPYEMDCDNFFQFMYDCFVGDRLPTPTHVVCEAFTIGTETGKKTQAPWSLELLGFCRGLCMLFGVPFIIQKVGDATSFDRDGDTTKLKKYGLWTRGGAGHARSAARHFVLWCCSQPAGLSVLKTRLTPEAPAIGKLEVLGEINLRR